MIIHHQSHVGGFAGGLIVYWIGAPLLQYRISKSSAAPSITILDFERGRRGFARGFARGVA